MTTPENIRIGDREREDAITALSAHFTAGRLDVDEYGERTAKATAARVRADLHALFADLPEPRSTPPTQVPSADTAVPAGPYRRREAAGATVVLVWLVALALMFILRMHYVIFIPIVLTVLLWAGFWGRGGRNDRRRYRG